MCIVVTLGQLLTCSIEAKKLLRNLFDVKVWMEVETTKQISFSLGEKNTNHCLSLRAQIWDSFGHPIQGAIRGRGVPC